MERIQKIISESGYTSRRKAEKLIEDGEVYVNGKKAEIGMKVSNKDIITISGKTISKDEKVYFLLNKPRGVITSTKDEFARKTVIDLIDTDKRIYPVGRLDYDTTGLLILTNDGDFSNMIIHPKNNITKVYLAKVEGKVLGSEIKILENGIKYEKSILKADKVKLKKYDKNKDISYLEITIHEGKNHEIKNMLNYINHPVIKLKREKIGFLSIGNLKSGEYRILSKKEISNLYVLANIKKD